MVGSGLQIPEELQEDVITLQFLSNGMKGKGHCKHVK